MEETENEQSNKYITYGTRVINAIKENRIRDREGWKMPVP